MKEEVCQDLQKAEWRKGGLPTCLCLLVSPSRDAPAWVSIYILAQIQMVEMNYTGTSSTAQICRQQEPPLLG